MMKRLLKLLTAAVAVIVLFTACEQFLKDPEDFLSYWASEAFIKDHSIDSAHRPDGAGVPCVGSSVDVHIMLTVHNPKNFPLVMPTFSAPAGIVEFKELSPRPEAETDYELKQTGSGMLLTYKPSLLQKYEQGSGSLNPTITLKAKDGRVFKQTYTFGIKSNTPPPKPKEIVIAKTTETTPHYVLCLKFDPDEMKKKVAIDSDSATPSMVPVHKDIKNITIKKDSSSDGSSYNLSYNDDDSDFQNPEGILQTGSFIKRESVAKLTEDIPQAQEKWVLYYKTNIEIEAGNDLTTYYITLHDREGVVSDEAVARIEASGPTHTVTFSVVGGEGGTLEANYDGTNSSTKTSDTVQVTNEASVSFTATPDEGWEFDSWTGVSSLSTTATLSNITGNATVTVEFKKITYKVHFNKNDSNASGIMNDQTFTYGQSQQLTANGFTKTGYTFAGWATSADGNVQYTNQQPVSNLTTTANDTVNLYAKWTANTYKVRFNKNDSNASGIMNDQMFTYDQSKPLTANGFTKTGYTFTGWATSAGGSVQYTNQQSVSNLTTVANGTVNLYAKWTANTYTVTFKVDGKKGGSLTANYGSNHSTTTSATLQVTNGDSVTFTAKPDDGWEVYGWTGVSSSSTTATLYNVTAPTTVTVKFKGGELNLAGGSGAWEKLKKEAAKTEGAHTILIDGGITATSGNDAGEITLGRDLIIKPKNSSAYLDANNRSRVFNVPSGKTLTLEGDIKLKGGNAANGSGVYVGGTFKMKGDALVDQNNDVYLADGKSITVTGALSHRPAARITPYSYTDGRVLATGDAEKANFTVSPDSDGDKWRYKKVGNEIKFVPATLTVTFTEIKCVVEHDDGPNGEYYWTMKVDGSIVHKRHKNNLWVAGDNTTLPINKSFTRSFSYFPASIPVDIEIWEHDDSFDDHVGTTKAHLTYNYDDDQWKWAYDGGNWNTNPKRNEMSNPNVIIGDGGEEIFTEQYRTSDGDTDVTIKISWKE